jgi:ABC-type molybdate transport system ATPase subunit
VLTRPVSSRVVLTLRVLAGGLGVLAGDHCKASSDLGVPLVAVITAQSAAELHLQPGDALCAVVKTTSVHLTAAPNRC